MDDMSFLGFNIFDNFQIMYTHPLFGKLKTFNIDESNIFDLKRQFEHVFNSIKKNNTYNISKKHGIKNKHMEYKIIHFTHLKKPMIVKTAWPLRNA